MEISLTIELHKFGADDPSLLDFILSKLLSSNSFLAVSEAFELLSLVSLFLVADKQPGDVDNCLLKLRFKFVENTEPDDGCK